MEGGIIQNCKIEGPEVSSNVNSGLYMCEQPVVVSNRMPLGGRNE